MHRVTLIVYPGFELLDVSGPASVFNGANRALGQRGQSAFYKIVIASAEGGAVESSSGVAMETLQIAELVPGTVDTVLVVGAEREPLLKAVADPALRASLPRLASEAERFGSVCTGGFVLAALGLLDGRRIATHWDSCEPFAKTFPKVTVDHDALYVVDGRLWTSAGVTTGIDMALAMVSRDLDAAIAGEVARRLVLYARRPGYQSQFSPILEAQVKGDSPFDDLIGWI
ncbi:GlxA family transcriptional regulator [Aureimonas altamirensis]|uniref:GlxA family transcriptional regulator n=2 Tax=Aureimonas TaxID=414371 RepID=UPI002555CCEF|nr:AraC family transcriptional regulator [Aureimonas altamirensis]